MESGGHITHLLPVQRVYLTSCSAGYRMGPVCRPQGTGKRPLIFIINDCYFRKTLGELHIELSADGHGLIQFIIYIASTIYPLLSLPTQIQSSWVMFRNWRNSCAKYSRKNLKTRKIENENLKRSAVNWPTTTHFPYPLLAYNISQIINSIWLDPSLAWPKEVDSIVQYNREGSRIRMQILTRVRPVFLVVK